MEVKIFWSDTALSQLEDIYDYYKVKASIAIARKLVKSIIEKTIILELNPLIGEKESLLAERTFEYRFLVEKNYKIIYRFNDKQVKIISVFDCRQNSEKIGKLID